MEIARDKKLHLAAGIAIAVVVAVALTFFARLNAVPAALIGAAVAGVVGYLKEKWYDAKRPDRHTVDMADFRFTLVGGILGGVVFGAVSLALALP